MRIDKLVVLDKNGFNPKQREELKKLARQVIIFEDLPENDWEAIKRIGDADTVIVCWYSINKYILDSCPNIKYLGIVATGYEWCDVDYALQKGIIVTNVPAYATEAVANYVFRQIEQFSIKNKTLGVIGLGNIGTRVAEIAKTKNLEVIYWDKAPKNSDFRAVEFDKIFRDSNIITLHLKLNSKTEKIIKNKHLDLVKKDSIIVDTVSPKLFDDLDYLIQIVNTKHIRLILDFDEDKKLSELSKTNKNIVYTPHIAWKSEKSIFNLHQIATENLESYFEGNIKNQIR